MEIGWQWLIFVYDWDTIVVSKNVTSFASKLDLCNDYIPCALHLRGEDHAIVEVAENGQLVCLSSAGCSQISIQSVFFACSNNTNSLLKVQGSLLNLFNTTFTSCQSETDGGVVQAYYMAEVNMDACHFRDIYSSGYGGAVAAYGSNLSISNSWFYNCSSRSGGGAVWSSAFQDCYGSNETHNTQLIIMSSMFFLCNTNGAGGAVLAFSSVSSEITESLNVYIVSTHFFQCEATSEGGALRTSGLQVFTQVVYTIIESCTSYASGGAISSSDSSSLSLISCTILKNTALGLGGGAIHLNRSYFALFNISTRQNTASKGGGGGVFLQGWVNPAAIECPTGTKSYFTSLEPSFTDSIVCQVGSCIPCSAGSFQGTASQTSCYPCEPGTFSTTLGSSSCISCPLGKYSAISGANSSAVCTMCTPGTFSDVSGLSYCTNCPAGTFSSKGTAINSSECISCLSGYYSSLEATDSSFVCLACIPGTYSEIPGSSACTSCPAGTFSLAGASTTISACQNCFEGKYSSLEGANSSIVCIGCGPGTYTDAPGSSECTSCPVGTFSTMDSGNSLNVCSLCYSGKYASIEGANTSAACINCSAGTYSDVPGSSNCTSCTAGTFSSVESANSSSVCMGCPAGQYGLLEGSKSSAGCAVCGPGTYSEQGSSTCTGCPAGTFSFKDSASSSNVCTSCLAGKYASVDGGTSVFVCGNCSPGTYSDASGSSICNLCPGGKFSSIEAASSSNVCSTCPAGKFASLQGANSSSDCIFCGPGTYSDAPGLSICTGCAAGYTSIAFGASSPGDCTMCWSNLSSGRRRASFRNGAEDSNPYYKEFGDDSQILRCTLEQQHILNSLKSVSLNSIKDLYQFYSMLMLQTGTSSAEDAVQSVLNGKALHSSTGMSGFESGTPRMASNVISIPALTVAVGNEHLRAQPDTLSPPTESLQNEPALLSSLCGLDTYALYGPCIATDFWELQVSHSFQSVYSGIAFNFTVTKKDAYGSTILSDSSSLLQANPSWNKEQTDEQPAILGSAVSRVSTGVALFSFAIKATFSIAYAEQTAGLNAPLFMSIQGIDSQTGVEMNSGLVSVEIKQGAAMCPKGYILTPDEQGTSNGPAVCVLCKPGTYSLSPMTPLKGSSTIFPACLSCPAGCDCTDGGANILCSVGSWSTIDGIYTLTGCPSGYQLINSTDGTSHGLFSSILQQCRACQPGQYVINPDTDICQDCPPGAGHNFLYLLCSFALDRNVIFYLHFCS